MGKKPTLVIAGTGSGCGKTMLTSALLSAFVQRGLKVQPFKCGPDYLDPLYHTRITGRASRNLDSFLLTQDVLQYLFWRAAHDADLAVVEGVMGYYDGVGGTSLQASTLEVAQWLGAKTVLVMDCSGMSLSAAAVLRGFCEFVSDSRIGGVILNRASQGLYQLLRDIIEHHTGVRVLGYFPKTPQDAFPSRHLGLVSAAEIADFTGRCQRLAAVAAETIDLDGLMALANEAEPQLWPASPISTVASQAGSCTIAVAKDEALHFYYQDNLDLLEQLGARLVEFSPLRSQALPPDCAGIYLGGGYPELHAATLEQNGAMRQAIGAAIHSGMPVIAESGGFLYLLDEFAGEERGYAMAGVIAGGYRQTQRLGRFGYQVLVPTHDNLLAPAGTEIKAHEFHYTEATTNGDSCTAHKPSRPAISWPTVHAGSTLFAGYPHIHFWSQPLLAQNFVAACRRYRLAQAERGGR